MSETSTLVLAAIAGFLLGTIFFGGLWWTVQRGVASKQPAVWFFGSLMLRTAIALAGFYFVMQGDWRRLVACVCGFIIARICVVRLTSSPSMQGGTA